MGWGEEDCRTAVLRTVKQGEDVAPLSFSWHSFRLAFAWDLLGEYAGLPGRLSQFACALPSELGANLIHPFRPRVWRDHSFLGRPSIGPKGTTFLSSVKDLSPAYLS